MAKQLTCQVPSSRLGVQPFLMPSKSPSSRGKASTMPHRPPAGWSALAVLPRTWRISVSNQSVHSGPAARPSAVAPQTPPACAGGSHSPSVVLASGEECVGATESEFGGKDSNGRDAVDTKESDVVTEAVPLQGVPDRKVVVEVLD